MYADELLLPLLDVLREDIPGLDPFDAHTHIGQNDPDGFTCTTEQLLAALALAGTRAAVFAMHEPERGYPPANDEALAAAAGSDGRLVAFARIDPRADGAAKELERCLDAGARGLKLHPRAEDFRLAEPAVADLYAVLQERRLPCLVHSGRGMPALGRDVLHLAARHPGVPTILAHMGVSDLGWLWREVPDHPNVLFDTSFWSAADAIALFAQVPPGRILYASDVPFGAPLQTLLLTARTGRQLGLTTEQLLTITGGQFERLIAGQAPIELGPPPGMPPAPLHPLLLRIHTYLSAAMGALLGGGKAEEQLGLAAIAAESEGAAEELPVLPAIALLVEHARNVRREGSFQEVFFLAAHLVSVAGVLALTPDVPAPDVDALASRR